MAWSKAKSINTAKIVDYQIFIAAKCETRNFILVVVNNIWVRKLRESVTFYTSIVPLELLYHLQKLCGGLHALDVLALQNEIQH